MLKKSKQLVDDLFEKSSMSFGEHLEELRKALTKAFIWLGVGTAVGLYFGETIVKFVEKPLRLSLTDFYIAQAKRQFQKANGVAPSAEMAIWMKTNGVVPDRVFIDPLDLDAEAVTVAEVAASEPSADPEKETEKETEKINTAREQAAFNPWKDVSVERLERLRPILLWRPIQNKLLTFNALEGFMIWLKAGVVAGAMLGSPGIFFHIWQFLAAGLYPHERRYVYWYLPLSLALFFSGIALAFFVVFPLMLGFLLTYNLGMDIDMAPRLNEYMSLALMVPLGFGIAFQLPIVMLGLHRFGIVSVETFITKWRVAVLVIAFLAMVLTPADVYTMLGLFFPLVGLYFFGIFLCQFMPAGRGIGSQAIDPQG